MPTAGIKVLTVGKKFALPYETLHLHDVSFLMGSIASFKPDVIVTSTFLPGTLMNAAFELRKRWIHLDSAATQDTVIASIENCYAFNLWGKHPNEKANPLISVYTAAYNTGDYLRDTYQSLKEQSYSNFEWVVADDHSTDGTWERLEAIAKEDFRVRPFRSGTRFSKIGAVKDTATRLCRGEYLVEVDHDDQLVDCALEEIKKAFESDREIGMVYSNCSNFFESGEFHRFTDEFWRNRYRETEYHGKKYLECLQPDIYDSFGPHYTQLFGFFLTVGPNHVRAYRASTFRELGGYNPNLTVADDWDLYARLFLRSKCLRIDKMLYLYRVRDGWANTTFTRNKSIQDHLELGRRHYAEEFAAFNEKRLKKTEQKEQSSLGEIGPEDLSVIVLEGATTPLTVECLKSVRQYAPGAQVILVANGSEPLEEAVSLSDKVVRLETNVKFSAGMNRGVIEATRKILCILNNDTAFVDDSPIRLMKALGGDIGITGPYSNRAKPPQGDVPREAVPKEDAFPEMIVGVCMVMLADLYRRLGGFDSRLYTWEDDDLCARARDLGYRCKIVGGTYIEHERHVTFKARGEDVHAVMEENRKIFIKKHPRIRVIAIAKDEERAIEGFLRQFLPVTRNFCLLDTGSRDKTVEIARQAGATVETCAFEDFSQARNEALRRFGADADWIIMLDPDERLDTKTIAHLKETLFRTSHDILLAPLRAVYPDGSTKDFVPKPFCFRSRSDIRWTFKVHEKLIGSGRQALAVNSLIDHVIALHGPERREGSEKLYSLLSASEPYFSDPGYREEVKKEWPILDYDRRDDPRISKIHIGPLISVVVPTYKRPTLLRRAVESVLNQDYENVEVIVVGDSCPDLSREAFSGEPRVRVVNLPTNHGAGGAIPRNFGIILAAGDLIAFLDDDNRWTPDHLSSLCEALRTSNAEFAFSSMSVDGADLGFSEPRQGGIDTSCVLHKKDLVRRHGWWKDRGEAGYAHDWEFFSRWLTADERWVSTLKPTLIYNADTSGQPEFVRAIASRASAK